MIGERRTEDRRISPAVGEHAIQECQRLREVNKELLAALEACELFARVNAPVYDGSPGHKGILAAIAKAKAQP